MAYRMGIDTGGTFTDLVAVDAASGGRLRIAKVPSTPSAPGQAVFDALAGSGVPVEELSLLVLGTTLGINAVLERRGARVLYLTTDGFQDVPFIQRIDKKDPYDLQWQKPVPFVTRRDCIGVRERVAADGAALTELTGDELERVAEVVEERLAEPAESPERGAALAVNLLFSYVNPEHERRLAEFLRRRFPDLPVSAACAIAPMWREYERGSTAILDAYLRPRMSGWIEELEQGLGERRFGGALTIMKSNGGQVAAAAARELPAHTMLSGLAGGVIGGRYFGEQAGRRDLITFDMGGTSTDVALVLGGQISYTTGYEVDFSLPVSAPSVDLRTVGAGGGSIAWIDAGGMLRVGPQSAGATPGPVCYGHGGGQVTVTDANLVLGRIDPGSFLGGEMRLDAAAARRAMEELGGALDMSTDETATAIVDLVNEQMADAIRVLTVERGIDPRRFALVAFGGAGPLHGAAVAAALGMREMIVPPHPGLTSAFGALAADVRVDRRATRFHRSDLAEAAEIDATLKRLLREAVAEAREQGCAGEPVVQRSISMRYAGQSYEQDVPVPPGPVTDDALKALLDDFGEAHRRFYGHHFPGEVAELIHFNVTAVGATAAPALPELTSGPPPAPRERRAVRIGAGAHPDCPVYRRDALPAGCTLTGPLIVEELDSTTLVPAGHTLSVLPNGLFRVALPEGEAAASTADAAGTAAEAERWGWAKSGAADDGIGALDPVTLAIIDNRLANITREMGTAMMHAAYSPIFSESKDFSCAVFDAEAELVGQGEFCPAQLGAMTHTVRWTVREIGAGNFAPGDVVIHNDPYRAGCHLPEHLLLKPVFDGDELRLFVAVIGHVAEIGAMVVGSFASNATEVFQEGLRLPPVKLMSRGEHCRDIWRIVMANHRTPRATWGDFHAMLGALNVGERRCHELFARYGAATVLAATRQLIDYSERLMRAEIAAIRDGEYAAEEILEDDGITGDPYVIRVTVVVRGGGVLVDFTRSDPQARGPINATFGVTASATYNAVLQVTGTHIPRNAGCYRPVTIIAPPGSIVNVRYPGPSVGGNTETQPRIVGVILRALAAAVPERVMASEGATSCNFLFGGVHPGTGEYYAHYHFEASGWGGRSATDGNSAQNHIHGNCRNTPVEIFETLFPFRVLSYGLNRDSGGAGRRRGGLGTRRDLLVTGGEVTVSMMMDHVKSGALGLFGGATGGLSGVWVRRAGERTLLTFPEAFGVVSPSKFADVVVREGDRVRIDSAGGAGYGEPAERDVELVLADVREGFVSAEAAMREYGVAIRTGTDRLPVVDETETARLRAADAQGAD